MSNQEPDPQTQNDDEISSLPDMIFVDVGMPEIIAGRTMRGYLIEEMLTALLREGILTKDDLSRALTRGEQDVEQTCQKLTSKDRVSKEATDAAETMARTATRISQRLRDKFITE